MAKKGPMSKPMSVFIVVNLLITAVLLSTLLATRSASTDGTDSLTSPNGNSSITATNLEITLKGTDTKMVVGANKLTIAKRTANIEVRENGNITIKTGAAVSVNGALVHLNSACRPISEGSHATVPMPVA